MLIKRRRHSLAATVILGGLLLVALWHPAPAAADAASILADLQNPASAVPGAQIDLSTANADEQNSGYTGQMMRVTMAPAAGSPLSGILAAPGNVFSTSTANLPVWDTAVMEAAKHEVASGGSIQGVEVTRNYGGAPAETSPELLVNFEGGQTPPQSTTTLSADQVATQVRTGLPAWAAGGTIQVVDDAAHERVVSLQISLPAPALRTIDPGDALNALLQSQQQLASVGARIGRATLRITDAATGDPLYTAGGDAYLGFVSVWRSPLVQGLEGPPTSP